MAPMVLLRRFLVTPSVRTRVYGITLPDAHRAFGARIGDHCRGNQLIEIYGGGLLLIVAGAFLWLLSRTFKIHDKLDEIEKLSKEREKRRNSVSEEVKIRLNREEVLRINEILQKNPEIDSFELVHFCFDNPIGSCLDLAYETEIHGRKAKVRLVVFDESEW